MKILLPPRGAHVVAVHGLGAPERARRRALLQHAAAVVARRRVVDELEVEEPVTQAAVAARHLACAEEETKDGVGHDAVAAAPLAADGRRQQVGKQPKTTKDFTEQLLDGN